MAEHLLVRPIGPEDAPWVAAQSVELGGPVIVASARLMDLRAQPGWIAERRGAQAGFLIHADEAPLMGPSGALELLAIKSVRRRRGVGARLLAAAEGLARDRGATRLRVETTDDNRGAIAFYRACGFSIRARHVGGFELVRRLKDLPQDREILGQTGRPIRDVIELEKILSR